VLKLCWWLLVPQSEPARQLPEPAQQLWAQERAQERVQQLVAQEQVPGPQAQWVQALPPQVRDPEPVREPQAQRGQALPP
jgi:hypothetical protein